MTSDVDVDEFEFVRLDREMRVHQHQQQQQRLRTHPVSGGLDGGLARTRCTPHYRDYRRPCRAAVCGCSMRTPVPSFPRMTMVSMGARRLGWMP